VRERQISERVLPWAARAAWVIVLVAGSAALDTALADVGADRRSVLQFGALVVWTGGVAAMALPAVWSLTATRVIVPASVPAAATTWIAGASAASGATFVTAAFVTTVVVASAEFGRTFVQASAYGEEDRHPLRPPVAYLIAAVLAWVVLVGLGVGSAVATATGPWWLAASLAALTVAAFALGLPRWHRLSRRWLVLVPIGLVVHDHLVLGETVMLRRPQIARIGLAPAGTDAADLTGPAAGHAIEIRTGESVTVVVAAPANRSAPKALHLTGCLVAPTRPGRALGAASARRLPVGAIEA
jgi:hypothetical protein